MNLDYEDMSIDELTALNIELANQKDELRRELKALNPEDEHFPKESGEISGQMGEIRAELLRLKAVLNRKLIEQTAASKGQVVGVSTAKAKAEGQGE